ncbi:beta/alpha barrel domain-containing protein [Tellurirhabdus bombi]|uniref:bifunctional 4-hydroxy-2-oxoglutarate aldolase/2-dehydro-3-deoxy-phosphogluconate aldolase n=1 Tax=Tellurirhabdus bombi TaxID=2907205 RepID=UPI001F1A8FD7|nr:bifunctional 4-hydroxy-2-oxoglutarate aldolase/2-dehydro-3-deoxy-phosphogluconate aldolase [Tellurirhabdus bombi]
MSRFSSEEIVTKCRRSPIVPVFYHADAAHAKTLVGACYEGGLRVFEFTNRGEAALSVFKELVAFAKESCPDLALGIGTILTPEDAELFIEAGADFVVQPVTTIAVGEVCHKHGIPWMPAGSTLNEIYQATLLGAKLVKVFPGNVVGPGFIRAIKGPMPQLQLMVTGGVEPTADSLNSWFRAGVTCVGIGSQLFAGPNLTPETLRQQVAHLLEVVTPYISEPV